MIANVDCDGVLADFGLGITRVCNEYFDRAFPPITEWEMWRGWGITAEEWTKAFHYGIRDDLFANLEPIEGAIEGVRQLKELGYSIRIVTQKRFPEVAISAQAMASTLDWLMFYEIPFDDLVFCGSDKTRYLAELTIDDHPNPVRWAQPAALNIMFGQPWNALPQSPPGELRLVRAEGWEHLIELAREQ